LARKLEVVITGDARGLTRAYGDAEKATGRFGKKIGAVGKVAGGVAVAGVGLLAVGLKKSVAAAQEAEKVQAQLEAQLKASGISYRDNAAAIEETVGGLSRMSGLDDEELTSAFTTLVRASGDAQASMKQLALVADLARAKNMDVGTSATIVGKVMAGNTGVLSRYGIVLEKGASATEALGVLQQRFSGQAKAYGDSTAGAQDKVSVATENLQETIGSKLLPVWNKMLIWAAAQMPKISAFFQTHSGTINKVLSAVGTVINTVIVPTFNRLRDVGMTVIAAVSKIIRENGPEIERIFNRVKAAVQAISTVMLFLADKVVIPILKPLLMTVLPAALRVTIGVVDKLSAAIEAVIKAVKWVGENTGRVFKKVADAVKGPAAQMAAAFAPVAGVLGRVIDLLNTMIGLVDDVVNAVKTISGAVGGIVGKIPGLASGGPVSAGQAYVVGERGPELFVPASNGTIIPNLSAPSAATAGTVAAAGTTINISFPNYVGTHRDLVDLIKRELTRDARRNVNSLGGLA
jgi:hypothetical protein